MGQGLAGRPLLAFAFCPVTRGLRRLLFGQAAVVAFEDGAILGREALGHGLEDAIAFAVGELAPALAAVVGVDEVADSALVRC